jgi:hypothetical protein
MKTFNLIIALLLSTQIWSQTVSSNTQTVYDNLIKTENRYDILSLNNGSTITEIYYTVKSGILTIYNASLNEDKTLNYIKVTPIPLKSIKSATSKKILMEGGNELYDFQVKIALKPGKKVTEKLYGDDTKSVNTVKTTVEEYFSEMDIARSFAGTVKLQAKIK